MRSFSSEEKDLWVVIAVQFGIAFTLNFVLVFLPFYIQEISHLNSSSTLIWTGLILGSSSVTAAIASPFWGRLTSKVSPKSILDKALLTHALVIISMAFIKNIYLLFVLRFFQGFLGGVSTITLIILASTSVKEKIAERFAYVQSSITLGLIIGPPIGGISASLFGYNIAFIIGGILTFGVFLISFIFLSKIPPQSLSKEKKERISKKTFIFAWMLCIMATTQISFLPAVLPEILKGMKLFKKEALAYAGWIITAYALSSTIGAIYFSRFSENKKKVIAALTIAGSLLLFLLYFGNSVISFTIIRMLQTVFIAAVLPLTLSIYASGGGERLGFLNTSRFIGNGFGPIAGTFILATSSLFSLYLLLAMVSLIFLSLYLFSSSNSHL